MTAAAVRRKAGRAVEVTAVRLNAKAAHPQSVAPSVERVRLGLLRADQVLVEVRAAGVNPSDVKAAIGLMPYAVFPRTPGRDYAGVVIEGPRDLVGREVFGSSGDLGIRQDGSHATHLLVEAEAVVEKPGSITLDEAAGIGVPFVTAWEGFSRAGPPESGDTVLVLGLNGKVGQAAAQIATWRGARVIGVVRKDEPYEGHASSPVEVIDSSRTDVAARVRELTGGRGADVVLHMANTPASFVEGIEMLKRGGMMLEMGNFADTGETSLNVHRHVCSKNIRLIGLTNHPSTGYGPALRLLERYANRYPFAEMVSHEFGLADAEQAMREAERALGQGQDGPAVDAQGRALEGLQRGQQGMAQQMQQMMQQGDGTEQADGNQPGQPGNPQGRGQASDRDNDPLGRPTRNRDFSDGRVKVPGANESATERARRILEELRRKLGDPTRPREELDYFDRLLRRN